MKEAIQKEIIRRAIIPILIVLLFAPFIYYNLPQQANFDATVYDDAEILSANTEAYVTQLNNRYTKYNDTPRLVVVTMQRPVGPIELYAHQVFNELGLNDNKHGCGLLFIVTKNGEYFLQYGEGFEQNPILEQNISQDFVTEEMYALLEAGLYDDFIIESVNCIDTILRDNESGVYKEALTKRNTMLIVIGVVFVAVIASYVIERIIKKKKEEKLQAAEREESEQALQQLLEKYNEHMLLFGAEKDIIVDILKERFLKRPASEINSVFFQALYELYESYCVRLFEFEGKKEYTKLYKEKWQELNPIGEYQKLNIVSAQMVVEKVHSEQEEKAKIANTNKASIVSVFSNIASLLPAETAYEALNIVKQHTPLGDKILSTEEIQDNLYFAVEVINMEHPANLFIDKNSREGPVRYHTLYKKEKAYLELVTSSTRPPSHIAWEDKKKWLDNMLQQYIQKEINIAISHEKEFRQKMQQYQDWNSEYAE